MIEVCNLTKRFGKKVALDNVSFTINKGEIVGFLGPNGAGKSTTMNIVTGYISSSEGSVKIDGLDILEKPNEAKKKIGYLPEQPPLYTDMLVDEYLDFVYDLKKTQSEDKKAYINEIMELVKIDDVKTRRIANLSKGYKQRVGLAQALIGNPDVLILDEPTVGLDPKQIIEVRDVIKKLGEERTVILSSHILTEVSAVCERIIIINEGKVVAEDTTENLSRMIEDKIQLEITAQAAAEIAQPILEGVEKIEEIMLKEENENSSVFVITILPEDYEEINKNIFFAFAQAQTPINTTRISATLEDVFLKIIGKKIDVEDDLQGLDEETDISEEIDVDEIIKDEADETDDETKTLEETNKKENGDDK